MATIIGCLMLTSCAQQIGQATFLSSKTMNFTYQQGAKGNMEVEAKGSSIDDAAQKAIQKANGMGGGNYDALIDVKIYYAPIYCVIFVIPRYEVKGTPVNTSLIKLSMRDNKQFNNYCLIHNYIKPLSN